MRVYRVTLGFGYQFFSLFHKRPLHLVKQSKFNLLKGCATDSVHLDIPPNQQKQGGTYESRYDTARYDANR